MSLALQLAEASGQVLLLVIGFAAVLVNHDKFSSEIHAFNVSV